MPTFPGFHLVPASTWVKLHPEKQQVLRNAGGFPVNDAFIPLWRRDATEKREIEVLYGTYGSSKTTDRITYLVISCLTDRYFKCFYGREVFDLAKKELHSTIVSTIKDMGFAHLFEFSEKPNGSKEILCIANGNKFKPFGCDDPDSVKGWDNPTHIFVDEMNQISFKSFGMLQSRLRKKGAKKWFCGCFNNCDVYEDHWIRTQLLNPEMDLVDDKGNVIVRNVIEHFSVFTDNYFIDQEDYKQTLIEQAGNDPERREAILLGKWGAKTTGQPFYKDFSQAMHVRPVQYNPKLALHVSFDENVNPYLPVGIFQVEGKHFYAIDEIAAENPCNKLRWVCKEIYERYGPSGKNHTAGMYIYGDATSLKEDTKLEKGKNLFTLAKEYLEHFKPSLRTTRANPNVAMRGNFINDVLSQNILGLHITLGQGCKHMIKDFLHTSESPDGNGKDKTKETVEGIRGVQRWGHFTDLFDYVFCRVYAAQYTQFQNGGTRPKWTMAPRTSHNSF